MLLCMKQRALKEQLGGFFFFPLSSGSQRLCLCLSRPTAIHSNAPSPSACSEDEVQLAPVLTKGVLLHPLGQVLSAPHRKHGSQKGHYVDWSEVCL